MREKPNPITDSEEHEITYEVWVQYEAGDRHWYARIRWLETLEDAQKWIKRATEIDPFHEPFKILKSEVHTKLTVID